MDELLHWRNRVREIRESSTTNTIDLDAATKQLILDLRERVAMLEQHAAAAEGMVEALSLVMELHRASDARSAKLEQEAIEIGRAFTTIMSVMQPVLKKTA